MEKRQSYNYFISTMRFPILIRWHLYNKSGPGIFMKTTWQKTPNKSWLQEETSTMDYLHWFTNKVWAGPRRSTVSKHYSPIIAYVSTGLSLYNTVNNSQFFVESHDIFTYISFRVATMAFRLLHDTLSISFRVASLALGQLYYCPNASGVSMNDMHKTNY